jgi:hypothetical protein
MSQTIILIVVISNMLITPVVQYLLSSRCTEVDCCCVKFKREPVEMNSTDIQNITK